MLPASKSGTRRTSVRVAGYRRVDFLRAGRVDADSVIEGQWAVEDSPRNLAALGHLAERRGIEG
jgi:hypothetical protein